MNASSSDDLKPGAASTALRVCFALTAVVVLLVGCQTQTERVNPDQSTSVESARTPLETVNLRMQAYNDHDLEVFMSTYAEDVEIFTYPDTSLRSGKKRVRSLFEDMLRDDSRRVEIHHQIAKDSFVINHETVSASGEETEYVSIYEVRNGLIRSVRFVRDRSP